MGMNVKIDDLTDGKFEEIQKRLQKTEAAENRLGSELESLLRQNIELKRKIKTITRTKKVSKKINKLIANNIDEKNRKILKSNEPRVLFSGFLMDYSKKHKMYKSKWCKLTNDGELLLFKNENATDMERMFDLVSIYDNIKEKESEFELVSASKPNHSFRSESEHEIKEWIGKIKVVQYYFKIKSEHHLDESDEDEVKQEEVVKQIEVETDPFWLDISQKMECIDYQFIKKCIPSKKEMIGKKRWKQILWKAEYGEYELLSNVQLVCYDTGKWTEDDKNILFASVTKYGINSLSSWQKIADNLNRDVNDVMKKYAKAVGIPVKKLKKMAVARG